VRTELKGFKEKCILKIKENNFFSKNHSPPPVPDLSVIEFFWGRALFYSCSEIRTSNSKARKGNRNFSETQRLGI
jgi:hypothetical protein